jgi:small subunit ribosomal protein S8
MTDSVSDLLTRIRNGIEGRKATIEMPSCKLTKRVADILAAEGYLAGVTTSAAKYGQTLSLTLRWDPQHRPAINGIRRVSRPGQRRYVAATDIPKVRNGLGTSIVSTSKGLLTDREARKQNIGGEILCEVW